MTNMQSNTNNRMAKTTKMTLLAAVISATFVLPQAVAGDQQASAQGANSQENARGDRENRRHRGMKIFKRLDTNEDGVLSLDEMTAPTAAKAEKVFTHKDTDEDGLLSLEEFSLNRRGEAIDLSEIADEIVQCVADLKDETGSEYIVVPEASQFKSPAERFAAIDSNEDGSIDLAEMQAHALAKATTAFTNMDSDENGEVSKNEFKAKWKTHKATKRAIHQCVSEILDAED